VRRGQRLKRLAGREGAWSLLAVVFLATVTAHSQTFGVGAPIAPAGTVGSVVYAGVVPVGYRSLLASASARGGRTVASLLDCRPRSSFFGSEQPRRGCRAAIAFSDDAGTHWQAARWDSGQYARALAFDSRSDFGVAVGAGGVLATSDDRGATWTIRREDTPRVYIDVAVAGHTVAIRSDSDGVWISTDGGVSLRTLADGASATPHRVVAHEGAVWAWVGGLNGSTWWRGDASGSVERVSPR